jgi:hypothetical protein
LTRTPAAVWDKAKADGFAREKPGPDALWHHLKPLWPEDQPHLSFAEMAEWFAVYVYLPKLRDRVALGVPFATQWASSIPLCPRVGVQAGERPVSRTALGTDPTGDHAAHRSPG